MSAPAAAVAKPASSRCLRVIGVAVVFISHLLSARLPGEGSASGAGASADAGPDLVRYSRLLANGKTSARTYARTCAGSRVPLGISSEILEGLPWPSVAIEVSCL